MNKPSLIAVGIALIAIPLSLHAQTGCTDSPENPTAVLGLVGGAGAILASVRNRYKANKAARK
jgi:XrtJ-associated TM-motif-TM protein